MYAIDSDNDAVFGELAGIMKSTKRVVDTALLMSEQFTQASPVCAEVSEVSGFDTGKGKDADDGVDTLKKRDVNDVKKDAAEDVLAEDACRSGTGEDAEDGVLEEGIRGSGISGDYDDGVKRDVWG